MRTRVFAILITALALAALQAAPLAGAASVDWQQAYDGTARAGDAFTSVVAGSGGVWAAGYTAVSWANRSDMLLVRYAANGTRSWVRRWNGPSSGSDQCWDMTRDGRGGLYLVGRTAGRGGDAAILRYSSDGRLSWSRRFDSGSSRQDDARFVRGFVGGAGVYVVVESWSGTAYRTRVLRYSGNGARLWTAALTPGTRVSDVTTDAGNDLYLSCWSGSATGSEAELASFSPTGARRWTVRLSGDAAYVRARAVSDRRSGIVWAMDTSDDAVAPGHGSVYASPYAPFAQQWGGDLGLTPPFGLNDVGGTRSGGAIAVGRTRSDGSNAGFIVQLDATGAVAAAPLTWTAAAGCSGDLVATTSGDGAWVAGKTGTVFSALRYLPASGLTWRYDYAARPAGRALALAATSDDGAYVAGWGRATGAGADALILRLTP
jgi:hypothetical protein